MIRSRRSPGTEEGAAEGTGPPSRWLRGSSWTCAALREDGSPTLGGRGGPQILPEADLPEESQPDIPPAGAEALAQGGDRREDGGVQRGRLVPNPRRARHACSLPVL